MKALVVFERETKTCVAFLTRSGSSGKPALRDVVPDTFTISGTTVAIGRDDLDVAEVDVDLGRLAEVTSLRYDEKHVPPRLTDLTDLPNANITSGTTLSYGANAQLETIVVLTESGIRRQYAAKSGTKLIDTAEPFVVFTDRYRPLINP
jgi:hypothetical protein